MSHNTVIPQLIPLEILGSFAADIGLEALHLDAGETSATRLFQEAFPDTAALFLTRWEQMLGLAVDTAAQRSDRVAEVLYRLRAIGRLDRQYFIDLAAAVGFQITITELRPLMAGWMQASDELLVQDVIWMWQVTTAGGFTQYARAGTMTAGAPITWYRDDLRLKEIFEELKPAHTLVIFV